MKRDGIQRTKEVTGQYFHYCPGCTHGIIHRLVAEVSQELGVLEGYRSCASWMLGFAYDYFNCDMQEAARQGTRGRYRNVKRYIRTK